MTVLGLEMHRAAIIGAGLFAIAGFVGAASAADLPARTYAKAPVAAPVMTYNWSGCYIGGNLGGGFGHKDNTDQFLVPNVSLGGHDVSGVAGGGQVGCDYQTGQFVFGIRGMADGASLTGQNSLVRPANPNFAYNTRISSFETITARAGILAAPSVLLYVQGGGAAVQERHQQLVLSAVTFAESQTWTGWAVGAGVEWIFAPNWSLFGEYNYVGLGNKNSCFVARSCENILGQAHGGIGERLNLSTAMVGMNYRFGGPVDVKY